MTTPPSSLPIAYWNHRLRLMNFHRYLLNSRLGILEFMVLLILADPGTLHTLLSISRQLSVSRGAVYNTLNRLIRADLVYTFPHPHRKHSTTYTLSPNDGAGLIRSYLLQSQILNY